MSKDLKLERGDEYDLTRDELVEAKDGRCVAVAWVRRSAVPSASSRVQFKKDDEFDGFAERIVECVNACAGIGKPGEAIPKLAEFLRQMDRVDRGGKIPWVHSAAVTGDIEKLRAICLAYVEVWNQLGVPLLELLGDD